MIRQSQPAAAPKNHDCYQHGKIPIKVKEMPPTHWWRPTVVHLDLKPTQEEGNHALYWKACRLPWASEAMDLKERVLTILLLFFFN